MITEYQDFVLKCKDFFIAQWEIRYIRINPGRCESLPKTVGWLWATLLVGSLAKIIFTILLIYFIVSSHWISFVTEMGAK